MRNEACRSPQEAKLALSAEQGGGTIVRMQGNDTRVLKTHTSELFSAAVREASALLRDGQVVALPTETVYGLAANAFDADAVQRIYKVKGRPAHNPIIVHVANAGMAHLCAAQWPASAARLAAAFWPGPLTLVVPKSDRIPATVTAGGATVGLRWPSHPFIQAVIRECGFPLAAPSANPANRISPTTAAHVIAYFNGRIPLVVDGGPCQVGIESTVVDATKAAVRILRPGMIHAPAIRSVAELRDAAATDAGGALRSPGLLKKHYSPSARLLLVEWGSDADLAEVLRQNGNPARTHLLAFSRVPSVTGLSRIAVIPHDPQAYARAIYSELHLCDEAGAELIIVEKPPDTPEWRGIADRLARAAVGNSLSEGN